MMKKRVFTDDYEDIIHLENPTSQKYPRMSPEKRAAQFSPFAALTGHEEAVKAAERVNEEWYEKN